MRLRQGDHHREATVAFEDLARSPPADRGSHGVLHVLRRDAQASHRVTIDANVEHGETRRLLDFHVRRALRFTQRRCDLLRSEEHTSELQSLMRISYAVFCLKKKNKTIQTPQYTTLSNTHTHKIHQTITTIYIRNRQ